MGPHQPPIRESRVLPIRPPRRSVHGFIQHGYHSKYVVGDRGNKTFVAYSADSPNEAEEMVMSP